MTTALTCVGTQHSAVRNASGGRSGRVAQRPPCPLAIVNGMYPRGQKRLTLHQRASSKAFPEGSSAWQPMTAFAPLAVAASSLSTPIP